MDTAFPRGRASSRWTVCGARHSTPRGRHGLHRKHRHGPRRSCGAAIREHVPATGWPGLFCAAPPLSCMRPPASCAGPSEIFPAQNCLCRTTFQRSLVAGSKPLSRYAPGMCWGAGTATSDPLTLPARCSPRSARVALRFRPLRPWHVARGAPPIRRGGA